MHQEANVVKPVGTAANTYPGRIAIGLNVMHQDANVVETVGDAANDYARRLAIGLNVVTLIERLQCELRGEIALRKRSSRHAEIHVQEQIGRASCRERV